MPLRHAAQTHAAQTHAAQTHSLRTHSAARRAVAVLSAAGAALGAGVGTASAATTSGDDAAAAVGALGPAVAPVTHLQLNPLGRTPVDPTTNGVGTQIADFRPISTGEMTKPLSDGDSLSQLPVVGQATRVLPDGRR